MQRVMGWLGIAICLALVVAAPIGSAAPGLAASTVEGEGALSVTTRDPTVLLRASHLPGSITVSAASADVEYTDDWREDVQTPDGSQEVASYFHRNRTVDTYMDDVRFRRFGFVEPNSTILIEPLPRDTGLTVQHNGSYRVHRIDHRRLERSHFVSEQATRTRFDYEYNVTDTLELSLTGRSQLRIRGDFLVYVWGAPFRALSGEETTSYRTGHWTQDRSEGGSVYVEKHFAYARLSIYNGSMAVDAEEVPDLAVFGDRFRADPSGQSQTQFVNASGVLATANGPVEATGSTLTADGGAYRWQLDDDGVAAAATDPPTQVHGGDPLPVPWSWPDLSILLPLLGLAVAAAAGATIAYGPNGYARWRRSRTGRVGAGPPLRSWRQWRAAGLRALAVRAEQHGWLGLAAWLLGRAVAWNREQPDLWEDYAVLLRDAGRLDAALDAHREAHALCWEASDGQIAANAYQAARTAARAGQVQDARHWFRIALRRDRSLLAMAENEPDFGPLLGDAEGLPGGGGSGSG